ncbi:MULTISPECIES: Flp family type IVb pilin [Paraburkholderia]|jgi:pilus assembly protein Flp/PilA|uniref:Flp family type IVb pilin n=1 Tax=Paraburkholderia madseniana TaxID=2599607 RepID=A0A6N6VZ51_9BURK|nr:MULTISPECIES: Flp family type IVb pilin [Paraburkholderia]KAE8753431.1 Flp family type IVb pilin [Paraburkholderia madseniana]MCX4172257.1 Flp family type IVb pilin [Paraburkholderia madseniana]MDQ6460266.1 Flp family type IVb pilin [Paraburkholderia madseniana]NPT66428.1 Flp family type IVb pilin [Paraburkholderia madseniana]
MKKFTQRFLRDNKGVTAIEYGLIAGLVVLVIATAVTNVGTSLSTLLGDVATKITAATPAA